MALIKIGNIALMAKGYVINNGLPYFQRAVPTGLQDKLGKRLIRIKLDPKQRHPVVQCNRLWQEYDAYFSALKHDPNATPKSLKDAARALLRQYGLAEGDGTPEAIKRVQVEPVNVFIGQEERLINGKPELVDLYKKLVVNDSPHLDEFFDNELHPSIEPSEVAKIAAKLLRKQVPVTLTEAFDVYLDNSEKRYNEKFVTAQRQHWQKFLSLVGDIPLESVTREHAKHYRDVRLESGAKTATVDREINAIKAIFTSALSELSIHIANPFSKLKIPGLGRDSSKRVAYTNIELKKLLDECLRIDDDIRHLFAVLLFTGARLAEVAGLKKADVDLKEKTITFRPNLVRGLKTGITRVAPLHPTALAILKKAISASPTDFVFPRYFADGKNGADSASGALNKWAKQLVPNKSVHCLRHANRDLYRAIECEEAIAISIVGWESDKDVHKFYGEGYPVSTKRKWMLKAWAWLEK